MTDIPQTAAPAETLDSAIVRLSAAVFDAAAEVATLRERCAALEKALRMNGKEFAELSKALGRRGLIDLSDDCRLAAEDIARALLAKEG